MARQRIERVRLRYMTNAKQDSIVPEDNDLADNDPDNNGARHLIR